MKGISTFLTACLCMLTVGCVSGWIDRGSSKYRDLFVSATTREVFRDKLGTPTQSWATGSGSPQYNATNCYAYDVFAVRGKIAKPGDGSVQATICAISVGTMEPIMIPITIASVVSKSSEQHTLVIFYDATSHYKRHELYDKIGRQEDTLGY
jgi:hypothetical protein